MEQALFIRMVLDAWNTEMRRADKVLSELSDEDLQKEITTGKNTGTYILGHLAAVHDRMLPLLSAKQPFRSELFEPFVVKPYDRNAAYAGIAELRKYWADVSAALTELLANTTPEQWFEKHNSVSAEDFAKEPHRNKLNVIINRTNHLAYHVGQLILLRAKGGE